MRLISFVNACYNVHLMSADVQNCIGIKDDVGFEDCFVTQKKKAEKVLTFITILKIGRIRSISNIFLKNLYICVILRIQIKGLCFIKILTGFKMIIVLF